MLGLGCGKAIEEKSSVLHIIFDCTVNQGVKVLKKKKKKRKALRRDY